MMWLAQLLALLAERREVARPPAPRPAPGQARIPVMAVGDAPGGR